MHHALLAKTVLYMGQCDESGIQASGFQLFQQAVGIPAFGINAGDRDSFDPLGLTRRNRPSRSYVLNGFVPGFAPRIAVSVNAILGPSTRIVVPYPTSNEIVPPSVPHFFDGCPRTNAHLLGRSPLCLIGAKQ